MRTRHDTAVTGPAASPPDEIAAWAASGAMTLSGPPPGGSLGPPSGLVRRVLDAGARLDDACGSWGRPLRLDWLALLGERAALRGLSAGGRTSCGGATRLLPARDGWVAVTLARPDDVDALPAWRGLLGVPVSRRPVPLVRTSPLPAHASGPGGRVAGDAHWDDVADLVALSVGSDLGDTAALLDIALGVLAERRRDPDDGVTVHPFGTSRRRSGPLRVLDLGALWAAPLAASLLGLGGAEVTRVEAVDRPDGARVGDPALHRLLNGGKRLVRPDLRTGPGRRRLATLIREADVVVEGSRARALRQLAIVAEEAVAATDGPTVWVSITGHGRASGRVGFGDDAAVAGGLVVEDSDGPWFCGDAVADPLSGLAAASSAARLVADGQRAMVEVSMAGVAASGSGPTVPAHGALAAAPRARGRATGP